VDEEEGQDENEKKKQNKLQKKGTFHERRPPHSNLLFFPSQTL
jgi:hypothetical protein